MANSTLIIDYLGEGLAAARPTTPPVSASALAFYFATDTKALSAWDGAAWNSIGGGSTGANPTATAADTAVNGSATTFMRSDAAPAVQKGSASAFGIVKVDGTTIIASGGVISSVGGGGGGTAPTIRASNIASSGLATIAVSFPATTVAGDLAIIMGGSDFQPSATPSGWTQLDLKTGSNWEGWVYAKVLSSGDISTGSVSISLSGTGGSTYSCLTFHGATGGIYGFSSFWSGSTGTSSLVNQEAYAPNATAIYWACSRANQTITITPGTQLQTVSSGTNTASGALNEINSTAAPFNNNSAAAYPGGNTGFYHAAFCVVGP